MGRKILFTVFGLLACIAIGATAWDLGAGEDLFWGLPSWLGLVIIAFAAWWFPQTIVAAVRRSSADEPAEQPEGRASALLSGVPVLAALLLFVLGRVFSS